MRDTLKRVTPLLAATALMLTGNGLHFTLTSVVAGQAQFGAATTGLIGAAYFVGFLVGALGAPWALGKTGHGRGFAALMWLTSAALVAQWAFVEPYAWAGLRFLIGVLAAAAFTVIDSWFHFTAQNANRGRVLAIAAIVNLMALVAGQQLLNIGAAPSPELFLLSAGILALSVVSLLVTRLQPPPATSARLPRLHLLARASPVGVAGQVVAGFVNAPFWVLAPVYIASLGYAEDTVAPFMSAAILGAAILQWPIGHASDRRDRRLVAVVTAMAAATAGLGLTLGADAGEWILFAAAFAFGAFAFPTTNLTNAHLNDRMPKVAMTETAGGLLVFYGLFATAGQLAVSGLAELVGIGPFFVYTACVHGAFAAFVLWRIGRRAPAAHKPAEHVDLQAP